MNRTVMHGPGRRQLGGRAGARSALYKRCRMDGGFIKTRGLLEEAPQSTNLSKPGGKMIVSVASRTWTSRLTGAWAVAASVATLVATFGTAFAADGDLDASFGAGGIISFNPPSGTDFDGPPTSFVYDDGRVMVADQYWNQAASEKTIRVRRHAPDGAPDSTFGAGGIVELRGEELVAQGLQTSSISGATDGGFYMTGRAYSGQDNESGLLLCKFDAAGSLVSKWGTSANGCSIIDFVGAQGESGSKFLETDEGGYLVGSGGLEGSGSTVIAVAALMDNGLLDKSFDGDGRRLISTSWSATNFADALLDAQGRLLIGGNIVRENGCDSDMVIFRLLPDGGLDPTFGSPGEGMTSLYWDLGPQLVPGCSLYRDELSGLGLLSDGKIVVWGRAEYAYDEYKVVGARLESNGKSEDPAFGSGGRFEDFLCDVCAGVSVDGGMLLSDGSLVIAGASSVLGVSRDGWVRRIRRDGMFDYGLQPWLDFRLPSQEDSSEIVFDIAEQSGRPIVTLVAHAAPENTYRTILARLENDLIFASGF